MSQEVVLRLHTGGPGCACWGNPAPSLDVTPPPPPPFHWVCAGRCGQVGVALVNKYSGATCDRPQAPSQTAYFKNQLCLKPCVI